MSRFAKLRPFRAPLVGLAVTIAVLGLFNAQLLFGRVMILAQKPVSAAVAPPAPKTENGKAHTSPQLVIPSVKVDAPIVTNVTSPLEKDVQKALESGVLLFAGSPAPGHEGNTVIVGHSSNTPWAPGNYKFVFMLLDKLKQGDKIYAHYEGQQYIYEVTGSKVVRPNDTSVLTQTATPTLTLITCTPVGTTLNRLVIQAKQVSPEPHQAKEAPRSRTPKAMSLPSGSQSAFQATKGLFE